MGELRDSFSEKVPRLRPFVLLIRTVWKRGRYDGQKQWFETVAAGF
jgi:hypothetical protein